MSDQGPRFSASRLLPEDPHTTPALPQVTQQAAYMASMMAAEVLMMLLTFAGSGIAYLPFLWVVGPLAGWLIGGPRGDSVGRLLVHLAGFAAPLLMTATILLEVVLFFTPVLGRGGTAAPPDLIVAVLMTVVAGVLGHPLIIMLVYASNPAHVPTPKAPHKDVVAGIGGYWFVLGLGGVVAASMLFTAHAPAYTAGAGVHLVSESHPVSVVSSRRLVGAACRSIAASTFVYRSCVPTGNNGIDHSGSQRRPV